MVNKRLEYQLRICICICILVHKMMSFYESDTNDVFCMVHYAVVPEESSTTMFKEQLSVVH